MELVRLEISKDKLQELIDNDVLTFNEIKIIGVNEVTDVYKDNPIWLAQKQKSDKEYKKLKEIEFKLIHKIE